ncbi:hypothetical protein OZD67_04160 [Wolbachia endosymbiont of Drosophila nikananu]|uniref:hypothetical protein n=1 Tax=Wolbachia endosymbiont of Drosophila nikananu TaxID=375550 RepID=UPI0023A97A51|nr:hypothetical protein [Wolbachia endosymbiont of Drosophila nikananu]MDE5061297.1 hypothetical protein [Wolbachia endosymbiont of Drosophila nikananu]
MTQNTEQNMRTREMIILEISTLLHASMYPDDARKSAEDLVEEIAFLGAEEQRRKDAEDSRAVHQWRLTADDEWVNAVDLVELDQVRNGYPGAETRTLYTRPANVAALEAEIALRDVAAERERQKSVEGWTEAHDDQHSAGQLVAAATCYAESSYFLTDRLRSNGSQMDVPRLWPWADEWWKPTTQRRDLVKATALILAEIERLDRAILTREGGV